jgi:hypothetical protein
MKDQDPRFYIIKTDHYDEKEVLWIGASEKEGIEAANYFASNRESSGPGCAYYELYDLQGVDPYAKGWSPNKTLIHTGVDNRLLTVEDALESAMMYSVRELSK